jgi:inorganic pyrophosphatase
MNIDKLRAGDNVPEDFNVIIEIPANSSPVKYEIDKNSGALVVDRFIGTAMSYPANYGFIPHTLSEDGDPIDVVVITPFPLIHGSVIKCRAIGYLKMEDENGIDSKILALPTKKLCTMYADYEEISHLPTLIVDQIKFFFENYKSLEKGKWVKVTGWENAQAAKQEILAAVTRYTK